MVKVDVAPPLASARAAPVAGPERERRLRALLDEHFPFVWRSLRRLGVPEADVDDAAQQVCWVAARRLDDITPGSERSFLFSTVMRVASDARRAGARVRARHDARPAEEALAARPDAAKGPDELVDERRARALLDRILDAMPIELRTAFILYEIEDMTMTEIAAVLAIPQGTVASRLRRAREAFAAAVAAIGTLAASPGGGQ